MKKPWKILSLLLLCALVFGPTHSSLGADENTGAVASAAITNLYCTYNPEHAALVDQVTAQTWTGWISRISGAEPVTVGGNPVTLTTRNSYALFTGANKAFAYLRETLAAWYPAGQIEEDSFSFGSSYTWKNLILTIPGTSNPDEVVILSAHYDSRSYFLQSSTDPAPGADDNGSGSAALLEAARIFQGKSFPRTIRLIWFTGEEQGLIGSAAYVDDHTLSGVVGVINLDMYGYDNDNDHCFELHVSTRAESQPVGKCIADAIKAYNLDLTYDFITTSATPSSDHASFWLKNIGAVEILENHTPLLPYQTSGCTGTDWNPNYHTISDTLGGINPVTGLAITKAALAAALSMADPPPLLPHYLPWMDN